jgi:hypothetical protein
MRDLAGALVLFGLICLALSAEAVVSIAYRDDGKVTLNTTPVAIGNSEKRSELRIRNSGANDMLCGRVQASLSETPGANSGERYKAGEGVVECLLPGIEIYCMSTSGTEISWAEVIMVTATATNTATPTVTP